jgi:hypothetical protein
MLFVLVGRNNIGGCWLAYLLPKLLPYLSVVQSDKLFTGIPSLIVGE